jgi:hypothetical protein
VTSITGEGRVENSDRINHTRAHMANISKEHEMEYRARIRRLMVVQHSISLRDIQKKLDTDGLHLDLHYIGKLRNKIVAERARRIDRYTLNSALSAFEDIMTQVMETGWEIAMDKRNEGRDRAAGLEIVRKASNDAFDKLFDAGVFDRKLGTVGVEFRNKPLTAEALAEIVDTFRRHGKLPKKIHDGGSTDTGAPRPQLTEGAAQGL